MGPGLRWRSYYKCVSGSGAGCRGAGGAILGSSFPLSHPAKAKAVLVMGIVMTVIQIADTVIQIADTVIQIAVPGRAGGIMVMTMEL